jgi:phosphoribosylanthranilate isomerase
VTRVKICGITRAEDAELAIQLGADYLGFIFVKESPRYLDPATARAIVTTCGAAAASAADAGARSGRRSTNFVGVFRDAPLDEVRRIVDQVQLDLVQLHGDEAYVLDIPTIRAFNVGDQLPDTTTAAEYVLFDTGGGTGRTFDWSLLEQHPPSKPFFLAGGINPDNVAEAIERTKPFAIDIASGVESAPGIKDHSKLRKLFERIER